MEKIDKDKYEVLKISVIKKIIEYGGVVIYDEVLRGVIEEVFGESASDKEVYQQIILQLKNDKIIEEVVGAPKKCYSILPEGDVIKYNLMGLINSLPEQK